MTAARMLWQWLLTPWRAHDQGGQWFMTSVLLLTLAVAVLLIPFKGPHWQTASAKAVGVAVAIGWLYFLPCCLRLAFAARTLRVPGALHGIRASLLLYAFLGCVLPALILGLAGGPGLLIGVLLFATAAAAFVLALLPHYAVALLCVLPLASSVAHAWLRTSAQRWPHPDEPGFLPWAAAWTTALALAGAARWWQVVRGTLSASRWRRPVICNLAAHIGPPRGNPMQPGDIALIRQRPAWLHVEADLRGVGPRAPVRSLRVALGGTYLPITWRNRARQWLLAAVSLVACALLLWLVFAGDGDESTKRALLPSVLLVGGWTSLLIGLVAAVTPLMVLHRRWTQANTELSLLALLPGLGNAAAIRNDVLRASLGTPLRIWGAFIGIILVIIASTHGTSTMLLWTLVIAVAGGILICAVALASLGRRMPGKAGIVVLSVYTSLLSIGSGLAALQAHAAGSAPRVAESMRDILWASLLLALVGMGLRGWRAFRQQPHPFLPNVQ